MTPQPEPLTRREFLYYTWAASMALFMLSTGGALVWFAVPRFRTGEFGGVFTLPVEELPPPDADPRAYDAGRFWLVQVGAQAAADPRRPEGHASQPGVLALYKVCVHLGCLYQWRPSADYFYCPCHGSRYLKDGVRVHRPATRNLDRFVVRALDAAGSLLAETVAGDPNSDPRAGQPLPLPPGTRTLQVDTGRRIFGQRNAGTNTVR
jgi:cytochrome b6-f complex iron-sulfur subunit